MMPTQPGGWPEQSQPSRRRDRSLTQVTTVTVVGGAGAVLATGLLATWLSLPAHAKPGVPVKTKPATGSVPGSTTGQRDNPDGSLRPPNQPPGRVNRKQPAAPARTTEPPPPPPEVSSGGS